MSQQLNSVQRAKILTLAVKEVLDKFVDLSLPAEESKSQRKTSSPKQDLLSIGLLLMELWERTVNTSGGAGKNVSCDRTFKL
jgi:hypothetical protein